LLRQLVKSGYKDSSMKLVPKQFDEFNPVVILMGVVFLLAGGYPLLMMPMIWGPPIVWLPRGIFGVFFVIGFVILARQLQLWRRGRASK
jgi:TRAP-type C4-dicarboxylate transport system permease small subunit